MQADPLISSSIYLPSATTATDPQQPVVIGTSNSTPPLPLSPPPSPSQTPEPTAYVNWVAYGGTGGYGKASATINRSQ